MLSRMAPASKELPPMRDPIQAFRPQGDAGPTGSHEISSDTDFCCWTAQLPLAAAVSTVRRNTLIFLERWSVDDEVSDADVLHG
jgi:hypothetical protein